MRIFILITAFLSVAFAYTDPECSGYDHETYGCVGECISTSDCPGSKYQSNLCPTQGNDIKCCFTAHSDAECATYDHSTYGTVGSCIATGQCPFSNYISNLCPTMAADIKCCFSKPTDTCQASVSCDDACDSNVKSLAQQILDKHIAGSITLKTSHNSGSGSSDGADPYNNIRDTSLGCQAKRSSYSCAQGSAPGGYVCLSESILNYILGLSNDGYWLAVNSLAGACHGKDSLHYSGLAVDLPTTTSHGYFMDKCTAMGGVESAGPGYPGSEGHTHCAFSS